MRCTIPARNALLGGMAALIGFLDGSTGNATLDIHVGSPPLSAGSTPGGTLLGTLTFSRPCFGAPVSGVATANAITSDTSADNSGTMGCFVVRTSAGVVAFDGTITGIGGGGDLESDDLTVVALDPLSCSALTLTMPEA